jgi:plasmid maintenance system antidote protein VapI
MQELLDSKGHDTVSRVIGFRRDSPTMSATAIAMWLNISPARVSKILRDAGMPKQSMAEKRRLRRDAKAGVRVTRSTALESGHEFACIVRELGLSIEEAARLFGRDAATIRSYCTGKRVPPYMARFAYLALALGTDRARELMRQGRTMAQGAVAKKKAKTLSTPVDTRESSR